MLYWVDVYIMTYGRHIDLTMCTLLRAAAQSSGCHGDDDHQSSDEDDEKLQRARAFDEFKDGNVFVLCVLRTLTLHIEHRRGEGNKKGKG